MKSYTPGSLISAALPGDVFNTGITPHQKIKPEFAFDRKKYI
jgi:hypothetical protein